MNVVMFHQPRIWLPAIVFLAATVGCKQAPPANVAAVVNGRAITYADLDKEYKRQFPQQAEGLSPDEIQSKKLELLRIMIDNEMMLQRAEKLSLMATDSEVDQRFNQGRAPYTQEEFQRLLEARNMNVDDLKAQIRRDLSVDKLLNKEISSLINITDKDVADSYNANRNSFNFAEPQIQIAQILVTPNPDPNVRNLKRDKAQNETEARRKMEMIDKRLKAGDDFSMLAQNYSEDPQSAPNGGDLGFIPESALEKANPELRKLVLQMPIGQASQPLRTPEGFRILKILARESAGQRELTDPRVQQTIRDALINRKDQLLRAAYYEAVKNEAKVTNYFALSIAPGFQKK
jgi:peptidyl-prolyl cis-trans isomerase SurA